MAFRTALFGFLFFVIRINLMIASGKSICLSHQYNNKMTSFVELLTIALLFCPLWLDKTINFCFPYICFYKFTHSVITVQKLFSKAHLLLGVLL